MTNICVRAIHFITKIVTTYQSRHSFALSGFSHPERRRVKTRLDSTEKLADAALKRSSTTFVTATLKLLQLQFNRCFEFSKSENASRTGRGRSERHVFSCLTLRFLQAKRFVAKGRRTRRLVISEGGAFALQNPNSPRTTEDAEDVYTIRQSTYPFRF